MGTSERTRFDHETVLVAGLGKSGIASVTALRERGAAVVVTDDQPESQISQAVAQAAALGARFVAPADLAASLSSFSFAVLSPGVPPSAVTATRIRAAGIRAIGEVELAAMLCKAPMIAITGTKGKSTTAALVAHLLRACGANVRLGGNIGTPLVEAVEGATPDAWVVAELSSFQLETIVTLRPRISVLLNIAPDHLDRYASLDEYARAKYRIFENQSDGDAIVLDRDDPALAALETRFRTNGCAVQRLWYSLRAPASGLAMYRAGTNIVYAPQDGKPVEIAGVRDVPLPGEHNLRNAMAALLVALRAGCEPPALRDALRRFEGLAHRLERVALVDGVVFVDDSKATNPAAAAAGLRAFDQPVVLIAGGRSKGTDFAVLGTAIAQRAKAVVAIGEAAGEIERISTGVPFERASSMDDAVERARRHATSGDVVLLSPACASFDMFASAEDRGDRFVRAIASRKEAARA